MVWMESIITRPTSPRFQGFCEYLQYWFRRRVPRAPGSFSCAARMRNWARLPRRKHKPCATLCAPCSRGLQQQCGFANAGVAAQQCGRPRHQPAAQYAVEFAYAGNQPRRFGVLTGQRRQFDFASGRLCAASMGGRSPAGSSVMAFHAPQASHFSAICCSHGHNYCKHIGCFLPSGTPPVTVASSV